MQPPALNPSCCHGDKIRLTLMQLICWGICDPVQQSGAHESNRRKAPWWFWKRLRSDATPGLFESARCKFFLVTVGHHSRLSLTPLVPVPAPRLTMQQIHWTRWGSLQCGPNIIIRWIVHQLQVKYSTAIKMQRFSPELTELLLLLF